MGRGRHELVCGWGINDTNLPVEPLTEINGVLRKKRCPYYSDWKGMLYRCFDARYHEKYPSYKNCTVCEEWRYFSNFIKWVDNQPNKDWQNCQLDKDFLSQQSKHYSPSNCVYIRGDLNRFLTLSDKSRGSCMIGVSYEPSESQLRPYKAHCRDPFTKAGGYIGRFPTELEAHKAWQAKKHEYACQLADLQDDPRVADALRQRYSPDKDWTKS